MLPGKLDAVDIAFLVIDRLGHCKSKQRVIRICHHVVLPENRVYVGLRQGTTNQVGLEFGLSSSHVTAVCVNQGNHGEEVGLGLVCTQSVDDIQSIA